MKVQRRKEPSPAIGRCLPACAHKGTLVDPDEAVIIARMASSSGLCSVDWIAFSIAATMRRFSCVANSILALITYILNSIKIFNFSKIIKKIVLIM